MGTWGSEYHDKNFGRPKNEPHKGLVRLDDVIATFQPKFKQALYAAANKGVINRGTWNHCGLNAMGTESGLGNVRGYDAAAQAFEITPTTAKLFVELWDRVKGTDEEATEYLRTCILRTGLFTKPGEKLPRIFRKKVYESDKSKFERILAEGGIADSDIELAESLLVSA